MSKEYSIPAPEGPVPGVPSRLLEFTAEDKFIEVGSLERGAFSYLGDWDISMNNSGCGVAYRHGLKCDFRDSEGELALLTLHFIASLSRNGQKSTQAMKQRYNQILYKFMKQFTIQMGQEFPGNIISTSLRPPEWMVDELKEILSK